MSKIYAELLEKSVYVVLKASSQRNGLLIEETDNSVKVLGLSRLSVIPKEEIAVIDIDRVSIKVTPKQTSELEKIKSCLEAKNRATREKMRSQRKG